MSVDLRNMLRTIGAAYHGRRNLYDEIAKYGIEYTKYASLNSDGSNLVFDREVYPRGACFRNAYGVAMDSDWYYCEGFASTAKISLAIHHAWLINGEGEIYDPTWGHRDIEFSYIGIPIENELLMDFALRFEHFGIFDGSREAMNLVRDNELVNFISDQFKKK